MRRCDSTNSDTDMGPGAEGSPERGNSTYIRAVPACILPGNEDSLRPSALAIGPYHHGNENLKLMEACKAELIEKSPGLRRFEAEVPNDLFDGDPLHLLDLLRRRYLVDYVYPEDDGFVLYSANELLMRGVKIVEAVPEKGVGFLVGGVSFCRKTATLALPRLTICEHFKDTFLNMAGYEATPGICNNGEITKFLCLFKGLLRDPESVAIMRKKFILCEGDDETIMDLFNNMCQNLHPDFLIYEVSEEDQMSQFGFLDKVKLWSREFYETYLAIQPEALGVVAAANRARIWGRELYQFYLNNQMQIETFLGAAIMLILRASRSKQYSPSLGTCFRLWLPLGWIKGWDGCCTQYAWKRLCCPKQPKTYVYWRKEARLTPLKDQGRNAF